MGNIFKSLTDLKKLKEALSSGEDINKINYAYKYTPLHIACEEGNLLIVKFLVENGALLNTKDCLGNTPLHDAVKEGNLNIVRYLIKNKANLNVYNNSYNTPLHYACMTSKHPFQIREIIKLLISCGANVNEINKFNQTPLHIACEKGNLDIVRCLVYNNSDVNVFDKEKNTPLHYVFKHYKQSSSLEIIKYLYEKGASMNATNKEGYTPMQTAPNQWHDYLCRRIGILKANTNDYLFYLNEEEKYMKFMSKLKQEIRKYKELLTEGFISIDEFYKKRKELLRL